MKKIFLSIVFTFSLCAFCFSQSTNILFDKDSYEITPLAKAQLDSLIYLLKKVSVLEELCLVGHTDIDADEVYNKKLSLNRAAKIKDYLLLKGISNTIHIESKGETKLINANTTESEKALNRRVEIIQNYIPANSFFSEHKKEMQQFEINSRWDTVITCKEGTKIKIGPWTFENANFSFPIIIRLQEYLTKSDFTLANLTTTHSDGRIIESRGMIYIEAYQNNQPLTIKEGQSIDILFKDRAVNDSTELFIGTSANNNIVWNQARVNRYFFDNDDNPLRSSSSIGKRKKSSKKKRWWRRKKDDFTTSDLIYGESYYDTINGMPCKIIQKYVKQKTTTDTIYVASDPKIQKEYEDYVAYLKKIEYQRQLKKDMDLLILSSPKLGWINCDRFYDSNKPKIDVVVKYEGDFVPNVVLVFKNINSVMPYTLRIDNELIFENIPEEMDFEIIGLHQEKETILFSQKEGISKRGAVETISFTKVSPAALTTAIKKL